MSFWDQPPRPNRPGKAAPYLSFFNLFDYKLLKGDPKTALGQPNTVVLTESSARRLFGSEDPVGQVLSISALRIGDVKITGVMEDPPETTHMKFDSLISANFVR